MRIKRVGLNLVSEDVNWLYGFCKDLEVRRGLKGRENQSGGASLRGQRGWMKARKSGVFPACGHRCASSAGTPSGRRGMEAQRPRWHHEEFQGMGARIRMRWARAVTHEAFTETAPDPDPCPDAEPLLVVGPRLPAGETSDSPGRAA